MRWKLVCLLGTCVKQIEEAEVVRPVLLAWRSRLKELVGRPLQAIVRKLTDRFYLTQSVKIPSDGF
ncbi:hypothetical protein [Neolewinella persica]|uniref:hypothetical protein n=1 Tax=Neolewinella persica TaxID=70998 RepID=UPI00146AC083|nr:hypothetical protein [Neolewinella persica]